jgi:hypothetical protein
MQAALAIKSVSVLELDVNNDVVVWSYPSNPQQSICSARASGKHDFLSAEATSTQADEKEGKSVKTKSKRPSTFYFSRFQNAWQYFLVSPGAASCVCIYICVCMCV